MLIGLDSKLHRPIVGILMGTNCALLVADLFVCCYKRNFILSISDDNQAKVCLKISRLILILSNGR